MVRKSFHVQNIVNIMENVEIDEAMNEMGHGRYNYLVLAACCIINIGGILELLGYGLVVPAASCDLNLTLDQAKILKSISFAGFLLAFPWGYIADTRGRRPVILVTTAVGFMFSAMASFSNSYHTMLALKFLAGCFSTAALNLTTIYLGESTCQKNRAKVFFLQNVFSTGVDCLCFTLAYLFLSLEIEIHVPFLPTYKSWRLFSLVLSVPLGIGAVMMCFIKESPIFLANKGKTDEAIEVLRIIFKANGGNNNVYPVKSLMATEIVSDTKSFWDSLLKHTAPIVKPPLLWRTLQILFLLCLCSFTNNIYFLWFPRMVDIFLTTPPGNISFCKEIADDVTTLNSENICLDNRHSNTVFSGMILTLYFTVIDIAILNAAVLSFSNWRRSFTIISLVLAGTSCIVVDMVNDFTSNIILYIIVQFTGLCFAAFNYYYFIIFPTSHRALAASLGMMGAHLLCLGVVDFAGAVIISYCRTTFYCCAVILFGGIPAAIWLPGDTSNKPHSSANRSTETSLTQ